MQLLPAILAQTSADTAVGQFMTDPFVQGVVLGVAMTALFAFVVVTIAGAIGRARAGNETTAANSRGIATPFTPASVASSVPMAGPAADHNPLGSFAGIDPRHLAVIAAAVTMAIGDNGVRLRRVTPVVRSEQTSGSAWTEAGRLGLESSHHVRR